MDYNDSHGVVRYDLVVHSDIVTASLFLFTFSLPRPNTIAIMSGEGGTGKTRKRERKKREVRENLVEESMM